MSSRVSFYDTENLCLHYFNKFQNVYHLCTPENHPIIFHDQKELKIGMNLVGILAKSYKEIKLITFELMNNHLHMIISGMPDIIREFFEALRKMLERLLSHDGANVDLSGFEMHLHEITTLENLRNAIAYANRNGSVIDRHVCPYTYPWGANRYFFNTEAKSRYESLKRRATCRDRREMTLSHKYDTVDEIYMMDGYVCPLSFCSILEGECLFRDARHYFTKISRHVESYDEIARLIGEQIYYTDDDLFSIVCNLSIKKYNCKIPSQLQKNEKLELAKILNMEYNAGVKQIQRMLKIDIAVLTALFGSPI